MSSIKSETFLQQRDLIAATGLIITNWIQIIDFAGRVTLTFDRWPPKIIEHFLYTTSNFVHHFKSIGDFKAEFDKETLNSGRILLYFVPYDLEIWWMTLENNRVPLVYIQLCASFQIHRLIWVKIGNFLSRVTLIFDEWLWKTTGYLSCAMTSFVHHFIAIGEFKLKLQSGNAQFWSKSSILWFVWPSNLTDDLEKNRAPLLSNIKLCALFHRHMWIQTGVTVRKRLVGFMNSVTLTFDLWHWPVALTSLLSMVITPENSMMMRWLEHSY